MSNAKNSTEKPLPVVLPDGTVFHQVGITTRAATVVRKVPNWREWSHTPEVQLWEACLLSLNLDPHSMELDRDGWIDGSGGEPFLTDSSFPSNSDKDEYELRLRVLSKNFSNRDFFSPCTSSMQSPKKHGVRLSEFATWAVEVVKWPDLPPELVALAHKRVDLPEQINAPAPSENVEPKITGADNTEAASLSCKVFRDLPNLKATELSIEFVAGDSGTTLLEISARKKTKRVALAELDLFDRRSGEMNEQCGILLAMAQKRRVTTSDAKTARRISRLRAAIKAHLGIIDNPIAPFRKGVGYEPHFGVTDKRGAADQRAKREAERKMVSLDELSENGVQVPDAAQDDYSFEDEDDDAAKFITGSRSNLGD